MNEIKLESGSVLRVSLAPFSDGKDLYQAVLKELKDINIDASQDIDANFFKTILCALLSSENLESKILKCAQKSLYNDSRITLDLFESEDARQDFIEVMYHVAWQNIRPFGKALFARYEAQFSKVKEGLKL